MEGWGTRGRQRLRGYRETIGERFERDRAALLPLPAARFEACDKVTVRVSSISLVRYRTNDYSVPTQFGHRQVAATQPTKQAASTSPASRPAPTLFAPICPSDCSRTSALA
jgi:hypothetical protein